MPESADQVHARIVAAAGEGGRLPLPASAQWDIFPWEVVDDALAPKVLPGVTEEQPRRGEPGGPELGDHDPAHVVWEDERWVLTHPGAPSGLPLVLVLHTRELQDLGELDDEMASELGRITNRLVRIIENLPHVARVHVNRWGDGGARCHVWFFARTAGLAGVKGSTALTWDDMIPPTPEDVWREDLHTVATKLANWGGDARA
ncbi:hypothetical protein [Nocardioides nanhaiensis]|uniref:Diadenosine tetraphosphate hydrolase n=1 Tax=Nocardioides nanhaiensis TaxID=1476871 RepID=A0ABP8VUH3_9ACTN